MLCPRRIDDHRYLLRCLPNQAHPAHSLTAKLSPARTTSQACAPAKWAGMTSAFSSEAQPSSLRRDLRAASGSSQKQLFQLGWEICEGLCITSPTNTARSAPDSRKM